MMQMVEPKPTKKLKLQPAAGSSISGYMALGRKFTDSYKLDKVGTGDNDDSDGEESSNLHASEANDADEHDDEIHNEIRERSPKET